MAEKDIKTMNEKNTEEVHEKISPKEYVRRLREEGLLAPLNNNRRIMNFEEKRYIVGSFLSKRKNEDRFNTLDIRKQWSIWWQDDFLSDKCVKNIQKELQKQYIPNKSKEENQKLYKKRMLHVKRKNYKRLEQFLQEKGLSKKYYVCDKTLYSKRPLSLGKYVILENGHSAKEKSEYFGTYEEVKNMIEELAQQE